MPAHRREFFEPSIYPLRWSIMKSRLSCTGQRHQLRRPRGVVEVEDALEAPAPEESGRSRVRWREVRARVQGMLSR